MLPIMKQIYATHIELFAFLQALPAASPVLSYVTLQAEVQGTISPNCCHMTVSLSTLQHGFPVTQKIAKFYVFYRIWLLQMVYFWRNHHFDEISLF